MSLIAFVHCPLLGAARGVANPVRYGCAFWRDAAGRVFMQWGERPSAGQPVDG